MTDLLASTAHRALCPLEIGFRLGTSLGGGSTGPAITTGVVAANRTQVPTTTFTIANNFTFRRSHWASPEGAVSSLKTIHVGFWYSGVVLADTVSHTIKQYIEYPEGVFTQVLWGGAGTLTVTPGGVHTSDAVAGLTIPAGAQFFVRTVQVSGASTANFPIVEQTAVPTALGLPDGNSTTDQGNSGTIAAGSSNNRSFGPAAIIGTVAKANARSFVLVGDSITFGDGDITGVGSKGGSGWGARLLDPVYPYTKIAKSGATGSGFAGAASQTRAAALLAAIGYSDFLNAFGVNDLRTTGTVASIQADYQTIYGLAPGKSIRQITLTPRSDSTDAYATTVNQTAKVDGNYGDLTTFNDAVRAGLANVTSVIDLADAAMPSRNANIWSGPFPPVTDGTHPTSAKAGALATALAGALG